MSVDTDRYTTLSRTLGGLEVSMKNVEANQVKLETKVDKVTESIAGLQKHNSFMKGVVKTIKWLIGLGGLGGIVKLIFKI